MRKRHAKDLLTDPTLRARVLARIRDKASPATATAPAIATAAAPEPTIVHVIEFRRPPFYERPAFAVICTGLGFVLGGYLLQLT